jgi:putative ABC transport system substrate-binding protein
MLPSRRRQFLIASGALLAAPIAHAQQPGKVYRIGYLQGTSATGSPHLAQAFRERLRDHGWIDGKNMVIEYRFAAGKFDRLPALAADLVRQRVDVIAAGPTPAAVAAKNATAMIPIVMANVGIPVELGLVASLARPGGNVTGLSFTASTEMTGKGLQLLTDAVPTARRVAILSNPANPAHTGLSDVQKVAERLRVQLQRLEASDPSQFDGAFAAIAKERTDALLVVADGMFILHRARLADLAAKHRIPTMYGIRENVEAGGLISYGPDIADIWRRAADYVDKILKGAKPADLPVEQPTKFELVVNIRTAKALGITIPQSVLLRADRVIE